MIVRTPIGGGFRRAGARLLIVAAMVAWAVPSYATLNGNGGSPNELWNTFLAAPGNAIAFEVDFDGDVTGIVPQQITQSAATNPFYAWSLIGGPPAHPITVAYDATAKVTRVIFSGGALPTTPPANWPVLPKNGTYHIGVNAMGPPPPDNPPLTVKTSFWTAGDTTTHGSVLTANLAGGRKKANTDDLLWAVVYTETKDVTAGSWTLVPYSQPKNGGTVKISITNAGDTPVKLGHTGYQLGIVPPLDKECLKSPQCEANQKALNALNDQGFPAPGEKGSKFIEIKPPAKPLAPGKSFTFKAE